MTDLNKSQLIREFKDKNPEATNKEIADALNKKHRLRPKLTPGYVSNRLAEWRKNGGLVGAPGRPQKTPGVTSEGAKLAESVRLAKVLVDMCGDADKAKKVIDFVADVSEDD